MTSMVAKPDQRFFSLIFDTIPQGIFTIDENGLITSFNRSAEAITGYTEEEVQGRPCYEIFQADLCEVSCPLKKSITTREANEARQATVTIKGGRRLPISIFTSALVNDAGDVIGGVEMFRDVSTEVELKKKLYETYQFEDIVTKSPAMKDLLEMLPLVSQSLSTVLIYGESGTGKELIARAIHNNGPRRNRPFIAINSAAVPDTLIESELFGYKKGAFTDAKKDKPGRFARAEKGTLFLDEVSELSPSIQAKLLRVLEDKEYEPLGGTETMKADVRIIAATNRELDHEVRAHRFRQDLFFRFNVVNLRLPPLRDRREDIPLLIEHFIKRFNAIQGRRIQRCSERVMATLLAYPFPGNVRELENAVEHAFVVCVGEVIQLDDLPAHIVKAVMDGAAPIPALKKEGIQPLQSAEAEVIKNVLAQHHGNRSRAAQELGISRSTLWRKMVRYGIEQ